MSNASGAVIIGRNEGERLHRCVEAVVGRCERIVYVDSGSTDGSVEWARHRGAEVVTLDPSIPFTAARARNEGFARLRAIDPSLERVQFIDGDCELEPGWLARAADELSRRPDAAVVCGQLRERFPERSIYNRLMDVEWRKPVGEVDACGGIFMARAEAFAAVGGFDPAVAAGEEPELCARLRAGGWKVVRLDAPMARHDAAILRFGRWWQRAVRTGFGAMDVAQRNGMKPDAPFMAHIRRARWWGLYLPAVAILAGLLAGLIFGWAVGFVILLAFLLAYPLQIARLAVRLHAQGEPWSVSLAHGSLTVLGKWAELIGHRRYRRLHGSDPAWEADKRRYPPRPFLKEQSIWAIAVYRFGQRLDRRETGTWTWVLDRWYWFAYRFIETLTGISLPRKLRVGPGLRIHHFGGIFIHEAAVIGAHCTLRQGVTIGNRHEGGPAPVIEDDVEFGAYAQVLGGVRIGRGARVGAMSVVLQDVPPGATAVGIPARVIGPVAPPRPEEPPKPAEPIPTAENGAPTVVSASPRPRPDFAEAIRLAYQEHEDQA